MAQDQTTLYNLALNAVGTRSRVSMPTENSREAEVCNLWYPTVRDQILCAAHWDSAAAVAQLTIQSTRTEDTWTETQPEPPWLFRFILPNDFLYPRHTSTFENFRMTQVDGVPMLLAMSEKVILHYTKKQTVVAAWDADLWYCVIQGLAAHIAMPLHAKPQRAAQALINANNILMLAQARVANRNQVNYDHVPDWLVARGVSAVPDVSGYIYQVGPLFAGAMTT
jgi:hypothetical protein